MLSIAVFKQNLQKIIFPIFPKTGSGTCPGSPPILVRLPLICYFLVVFVDLPRGPILANFAQNVFLQISKKSAKC